MTAELFEDALPDTQVKEFIAYQLLCAGCGTDWSDELDYVPWFNSRHTMLMDAIALYLFNWVDGKLWCQPCRNELICEAAGCHQLDEGFVYSVGLIRICQICGHIARETS